MTNSCRDSETDLSTGRKSASLYVHIPWCIRKCPYCDFNSHEIKQQPDESAYLKALFADLDTDLHDSGVNQLRSIFFGGGTPSVFSPEFYNAFLSGISQRFETAKDIEITLEANPGAVDSHRFDGFRQAGVNRISLGIQSFSDDKLKALGRIHSSLQAQQAVELLSEAGFENFNLDLMFALPEQTLEQALNDLETAIAFKPAHISWYQLTLEPNTAFALRPPEHLPDDDLIVTMMDEGKKLLESGGYRQYEISAYAREGKQCRHNLNYWTFGEYLGVGAGAHGMFSDCSGRLVRRSKRRHPAAWLQGEFISRERELSSDDRVIEYMMNRLRLRCPFSLAEFEGATGLSAGILERPVRQAVEAGLLEQTSMQLSVTERGHRYLNDLLEIFML